LVSLPGFQPPEKLGKSFMTTHHYVYKSFEEKGREYIGVRSCDCIPEEDTKYFGSFKDKSFFPTEKTILFVCETRKEVVEIEIELHNFFDVAVNPQFANRAKQTSTGFDRAGVPRTKEDKKKISEANSGENHPQFGIPHTEEWKKAQSEKKSGEKSPMFGVPRTEETKKKLSEAHTGKTLTEEHKKKLSEANSGRFLGALHPRSKAIIAIKPDGTELHYGSICEATRGLETYMCTLCYLLKNGHSPTRGKFKGWKFIYQN